MGYVSKNEFIRLRVADWEKYYISTKAAKAKMSLSEYVRSAAMDKKITVLEFSDELMTELRRQGNNLNQLTVMAHQGRIEQINYEPFMEVYENVWRALNSCLSRGAYCRNGHTGSYTLFTPYGKRFFLKYRNDILEVG